MKTQEFLNFFRQAAPYIHAHRGKTFVIHFDADFSRAGLRTMLYDCALLQSLGIKLILIHGMRAAIDYELQHAGIDSQFFKDTRITDRKMLPIILNAAGSLRLKIEAALSMGMTNTPMQDAAIQTAAGNYITARPLGVIDGQDYGYSGTVSKINTQAIASHLALGEIVIVSPIGYTPTGETYNLNSEDAASCAAAAMAADKLIYITDYVSDYISAKNLRQLTPEQAAKTDCQHSSLRRRLHAAANACNGGIRRVHLVEKNLEGALLQELFTRDGIGIMVTADRYDNLRPATPEDIDAIIRLIRPLEEQGILVPRPRAMLETEIASYYVLSRDGSIIACCALYPYPEAKTAELACLAVDPQYRQHKRADYLVESIENIAREQGLESLFILTTQTAQWFEQRGFAPISLDELPAAKREKYNRERNSKIYRKRL